MAAHSVKHIFRNFRRWTPTLNNIKSCRINSRAAVSSGSGADGQASWLQHMRTLTQTTGTTQVPISSADNPPSEQNEAFNCEDDPYKVESEKCMMCKNQIPVSYKNVQLLSQFVSPNTGRIYGRHITKLCPAQQSRIARAIKRAKQIGFMPFQYRETVFLKDPNLYDIKYTGNPAIGEVTRLPDSALSQEELQETESKDKEGTEDS